MDETDLTVIQNVSFIGPYAGSFLMVAVTLGIPANGVGNVTVNVLKPDPLDPIVALPA